GRDNRPRLRLQARDAAGAEDAARRADGRPALADRSAALEATDVAGVRVVHGVHHVMPGTRLSSGGRFAARPPARARRHVAWHARGADAQWSSSTRASPRGT